jgi:hypothetical protein
MGQKAESSPRATLARLPLACNVNKWAWADDQSLTIINLVQGAVGRAETRK